MTSTCGGLALDPDDLNELLHVDTESWLAEVPMIRAYYAQFGEKLPDESGSRARRTRAAAARGALTPPGAIMGLGDDSRGSLA